MHCIAGLDTLTSGQAFIGDADLSTLSDNALTIEQLAAETGMSVRNIRAHQARGLLPAPEVRSRIGYYGPEHVAQLRLIRELQDDGFNLGGIKRWPFFNGQEIENWRMNTTSSLSVRVTTG